MAFGGVETGKISEQVQANAAGNVSKSAKCPVYPSPSLIPIMTGIKVAAAAVFAYLILDFT